MKFKFLTIVIVLALVSVSFGGASNTNQSRADQELDLLYGDVIFQIHALDDTIYSFNVYYAVPLIYYYQAPILFEIRNDTTAKIISYRIINDTNYPNKIINFTIAPMKKDENATIHYDFWVFVKNNDYKDLPSYVKKQKWYQLPKETKTWLQPTKAIQSNSFRIKLNAWCLQGFSRNLIKIAKNVVNFTGWDIEYKNLGGGQDALSCLKRGNAVCTGKANLGAALFRTIGIPARDIIVMPTWFDGWYDMHYICQYYCPNYGWVFAETTLGITPYEPKNNIIMRVNFPEDENKVDYGGVELWFWSNSAKISFPIYELGPENGRRSWIENTLTTTQQLANLAFNITKGVYELYMRYAGVNFTGENQGHFDNATKAQKDAITCFIQSNIDGYMENITLANDEFEKIIT